MKKHLLLLAILFGVNISAFSQLPDGSIAPDFTLTDRDSVQHRLYDYLAEGKVVFIKFFACHCPGCWAYHQTGKLESIYQAYGPDGTDQIMVIMLEHDPYNADAFYGLGGYTQGDWITGNSIPMVDVEGNDRTVFDDYNLNYYPMVMKVCTDKTTELMSTNYSVAELFQEADDCAGNLSFDEKGESGTVYFDQISREIKLAGFNLITNVSIFNLAGQDVMNQGADNNNSIDASSLKLGMYVVQVENEGGVFSKKVMIQ